MSRFFCWFVGKKVPPPRMWSIGTYLVVFKMICWSILMYNFFLWVVLLQLQEVIYQSYFITLSTKSVYIIWVTVTWKFTFFFINLFYKNIYWIKLHKIYLGTIEIRLYFFSSCIVRLFQMTWILEKCPKNRSVHSLGKTSHSLAEFYVHMVLYGLFFKYFIGWLK